MNGRGAGKRVALITGGASGIGARTAAALARAGLAIAVTDLRADAAQKVAVGLPGDGHAAYALDVASEAQVDDVMARVERELGAVAVLVCCAGVMTSPPTGPAMIVDTPVKDWDHTFDVNARGVFFCIRAYLRARAARPVEHGRVVAVSSGAAQYGGGRVSPDYVASKAAVLALVKVTARQAAAQGITANSITPGAIETPLFRESVPVGTEGKMLNFIPLRRLGTPDEVAAAIAFLASPQAAYITGATIDVNGGFHMQ